MSNVASAIKKQLGGARFALMTGAKNFTTNGNDLTFKLGRGGKKSINYVKIELTADDLYTIAFCKARGLELVVVEVVENVYADQLQTVFTEQTGFDTKL